MKLIKLEKRFCPNIDCEHYGKTNFGNIGLHSFYQTTMGKRRRFICKTCKKTFSQTCRTPYYRLHHHMILFNQVAMMGVEGVCISSISRISGIAWNTVARWLELASSWAKYFNEKNTNGFDLIELQADEIQTFLGKKKKETWIFACIEVSSRLWSSTVVGRRSYENTKKLLCDTLENSKIINPFLFTSDGFDPYRWAAKRFFRNVCLYAQVIKKRRNNRVSQINRKVIIGSKEKIEEFLDNSEDSNTINTSFIERLNLTIRRGCSYLNRKTPGFAKNKDCLTGSLELLRCYYNFIRSHRGLKFGKTMKTPAMQAGLTERALNFEDIFSEPLPIFCFKVLILYFRGLGPKNILTKMAA